MEIPREKITEEMGKVSLDDIKTFFKEKGINSFCPLCSTKEWSFISDGETMLALVGIEKDGGLPSPPPHVPVACFACKNCGYVRLHALGAIASWKLQRANGAPDV